MKKTRKPVRPAPKTRHRGVALAMGGLVLFGAVSAILMIKRSPREWPPPPEVATAAFEPAVADLVRESIEAVRREPSNGNAWGTLGSVLRIYDLRSEALFCYEQAEQLEPNEPRWPYFHGMLLLPDADALPFLSRAVTLASGEPETIRLRLAWALAEHGKDTEAEAQFRQLPPDHPGAALGLAQLEVANGRLDQAVDRLKPALGDPRTRQAAHLLLASIRLRQGDAQAARTTKARADSLPPDRTWNDPFATETMALERGRKRLGDRAQQYIQRNQLADASPLVTRLLNEYPEAPEGWLFLGQLQMARNDCAEAERAFRRHLQLRPNSVNGLSQLGTALLCQERYPEAAQTFARVVQLKPDFGQAHFNLGFARARAGAVSGAVEPFREAIRRNPDFVDPYITLADLLGQMGRRSEAIELLDKALVLAPNDPRADILRERIQSTQPPDPNP